MKESPRPAPLNGLRLLVPSACVLLVSLGLPLLVLRSVHREPTAADLARAAARGVSALGRGLGAQTDGRGSPGAALSSSGAPSVRAPTAILVDLDTGRVLYAKNPDQRRPIASLAKIMTAMLVLDRSSLSDVVMVSRKAANAPPSRMGLRPRQRITVGTLLWGLLMWSGNDASVALAEHVSGSVAAFRTLMNERGQTLGLQGTYFASPSGLNDGGYSTVRDVAVLARFALANPTFAHMVATRTRWIPGPRSQIHRLRNLNQLLRRYPGAMGVKTGYTQAAGNCVAGAATRGGRSLLAVVLGDPPRTVWRAAYSDVGKLLDYGFGIELPSQGESLGAAPPAVAGGRG